MDKGHVINNIIEILLYPTVIGFKSEKNKIL